MNFVKGRSQTVPHSARAMLAVTFSNLVSSCLLSSCVSHSFLFAVKPGFFLHKSTICFRESGLHHVQEIASY